MREKCVSQWNSFRKTTNQIVKNATAVDVSMADWIVIFCNWKTGTRGLLHFFRFKYRCRPSNSGHHHLGLLIIPAGYGNGKKVKNRSSYTQNYAPKMQPFFDLLPSFVCRWLRVISSNFLWPGSRNYQIIGLPFWLTD